MSSPILPRPQATFMDASGRPTREFYDFLREIAALPSGATDQSAAIADLQSAVQALEDAGPELGSIIGDMSVSVLGQLGQAVLVRLQGDESNPDTLAYYGTDDAGTKGWRLLEAAFAVAAGELTKTVDADNLTTYGLADLADAGGGAFLLIVRDAKGRVSGTSAGDAADVPFDATGNTYVTGADVQAALDAADAALVDAFTDLAPLASPNLTTPSLAGLGNYADDTAASAGGVPVGGVYRNGSVLQIRVA